MVELHCAQCGRIIVCEKKFTLDMIGRLCDSCADTRRLGLAPARDDAPHYGISHSQSIVVVILIVAVGIIGGLLLLVGLVTMRTELLGIGGVSISLAVLSWALRCWAHR